MDFIVGYITIGVMTGLYSVTAASIVLELSSMAKDILRFKYL